MSEISMDIFVPNGDNYLIISKRIVVHYKRQKLKVQVWFMFIIIPWAPQIEPFFLLITGILRPFYTASFL